MDHIIEFSHSKDYADRLCVDLQMLQDWLVLYPSFKKMS